MPELDVRVRELVDACAFPITLDEVTTQSSVRAPRRARTLVVAGAAFVAAVVAVTAIIVAMQSSPSTPSRITTPATTRSLGVTPDCTEVFGGSTGCARTVPEAETVLGIRLLTPRMGPEGWALQRSELVVYPPNFNGEPNPTEVRAYRQVWAPPGTDLTHDSVPLYLTIKQRAALPGESEVGCTTSFVRTQLLDGTFACGDIPSIPGNYGTNGPLVYGGELWWTANGVTYSVEDRGLTNEQTLRVLDSLH